MPTAVAVVAALGSLVVPAAQVVAVSMPAAAAVSAPASDPTLDKQSRELIAEALANGHTKVNLLVATEPGQAYAVAGRVTALGATVAYRDDRRVRGHPVVGRRQVELRNVG